MARYSLVYLTLILAFASCGESQELKLNPLTREEQQVILHKGTERPFTGKYYNFHEKGTYICRQCNAPLYRSEDKFDSGCGWPSFDDEIPGAVNRQTDADGRRTEILCARCGAHLGHVFEGERLTAKNTRHCVNSISMSFIPGSVSGEAAGESEAGAPKSAADMPPAGKPATETAIFAGGCFWGVQYQMEKLPGVISTRVGYTGGNVDNPTYEQVCSHKTGHYEAVDVTYDPSKTTYEDVAKLFFEIHDPTQANGQGPDIGQQYESVVFYKDDQQMAIAEKLIGILEKKGYDVATQLKPAARFWPAEEYHQNYYDKNGHVPYCHKYTKRF